MNNINKIERKAVILHYAGIAARAQGEKDESKLAEIADEMRTIETSLGMTPKQILTEAASLVIR